MNRLDILMATHHEFVAAASLPEGSRPYSAQSFLAEVQKLIMEEIKKIPIQTEDDTIPF